MTSPDRPPVPIVDPGLDAVPRCIQLALVVRGDSPTLWRCDSADGDHSFHESHYVLGGEVGWYGWFSEAPVVVFDADSTYRGGRVATEGEQELLDHACMGWDDDVQRRLTSLAYDYASTRAAHAATTTERVHQMVDDLLQLDSEEHRVSFVSGELVMVAGAYPALVLPTGLDDLGALWNWLGYALQTYMSPATRGWLNDLRKAVEGAMVASEQPERE